jgi:hypothetical protein
MRTLFKKTELASCRVFFFALGFFSHQGEKKKRCFPSPFLFFKKKTNAEMSKWSKVTRCGKQAFEGDSFFLKPIIMTQTAAPC